MSFEQISYLAQILASVDVVLSLIFVGLQIRQNTAALQRNEHNSTMEQWTVICMAIAKNRDIAELMTAGLHDERPLDAADRLRLEQMLQENAWAAARASLSASAMEPLPRESQAMPAARTRNLSRLCLTAFIVLGQESLPRKKRISTMLFVHFTEEV
jgi:hypothetical protein